MELAPDFPVTKGMICIIDAPVPIAGREAIQKEKERSACCTPKPIVVIVELSARPPSGETAPATLLSGWRVLVSPTRRGTRSSRHGTDRCHGGFNGMVLPDIRSTTRQGSSWLCNSITYSTVRKRRESPNEPCLTRRRQETLRAFMKRLSYQVMPGLPIRGIIHPNTARVGPFQTSRFSRAAEEGGESRLR